MCESLKVTAHAVAYLQHRLLLLAGLLLLVLDRFLHRLLDGFQPGMLGALAAGASVSFRVILIEQATGWTQVSKMGCSC